MKECQSCTLPLGKDDNGPVENFGTNADGSKNEEYCMYCFQNGKFVDPDTTKEMMTDKLTDFYTDSVGMPLEMARELSITRISNLNRWSKTRN